MSIEEENAWSTYRNKFQDSPHLDTLLQHYFGIRYVNEYQKIPSVEEMVKYIQSYRDREISYNIIVKEMMEQIDINVEFFEQRNRFFVTILSCLASHTLDCPKEVIPKGI